MGKWEQFIKWLEEACINERMIRILLCCDVFCEMEYYLYIEELINKDNSIHIESGNLNFDITYDASFKFTNNMYVFISPHCVMEIEKI